MSSAGLRWGIIGTGSIARTFAKDLTRFTQHRIVAVGSRTLEKAQDFSANFGAQGFGSYEALVEADIDAVYVATPHQLHAANSILALMAGKPVLCEKPFAVNVTQSESMIEAARSQSLLLMEAMWSRYLPHYRKIREWVANDEIGEIIHVIGDHGQPLPAAKYHRLHAPDLAGGALLDLGIYPLSFAFMLLGRPDSIKAVGTKTRSGVDATTSAVLQFPSGAQGIITTTLVTKTPCAATVIGTKGRIEIDGDFYAPTSMRLIRSGQDPIHVAKEYEGHGLREQALYFERLLTEGKMESDLLPLDESHAIMAAMDEIRRQIDVKYPFE